MKKASLLKLTFLGIITVISLFAMISHAEVNTDISTYAEFDLEQRTTVVMTYDVFQEEELYEIDIYHESDDLLTDNSEYIIYLNQTSVISDTVYVYHMINLWE